MVGVGNRIGLELAERSVYKIHKLVGREIWKQSGNTYPQMKITADGASQEMNSAK